MTQTMRERLISAIRQTALKDIEHRDSDLRTAFPGSDSAAAIVDAILAELREPDEAMEDAGRDRDKLGWDAPPGQVFTAMIDAIRSQT